MTTDTLPPLQTPTPKQDGDPATERRFLHAGLGVGVAQVVGLAFTLVFFLTSHPAMDASPAEAAQGFYEARSMVGAGTWLLVLPLPFLLLFLGGLGSVLRRAAGGVVATTAVIAGVTAGVIPAIGALVSSVTPWIGAEDTSPAAGAVVKALDGVMPLSVAMSGFPRAVLVLLAAGALARAGLTGRGLHGFALLVAGVSVLGTATQLQQAFFPLAMLSGLLFAGWVASVAVVLRRRLQTPVG